MDSVCSDIHLAQVAEKIVTWEQHAPYFGLSPAEEEEIKRDHSGHYHLQKRAILWKWKTNQGVKQHMKTSEGHFTLPRPVLRSNSTSKDCYSACPHPLASPREWPQLSNALFIDCKITLKPRKGGNPEAVEVAIRDVGKEG